MDDQFKPPGHLSERSKSLWRSVVPKRAKSPERLALVTTALEALDRADAARVEVDKVGMTTVTKSTGAIHINPVLKIERESRQLFAKLWKELGFHTSPEQDGKWNPFKGEWMT